MEPSCGCRRTGLRRRRRDAVKRAGQKADLKTDLTRSGDGVARAAGMKVAGRRAPVPEMSAHERERLRRWWVERSGLTPRELREIAGGLYTLEA